VQTLVLTDIATGWTECAPLLVREQRLLTEVLSELRKVLPFTLLGLDTDNDSVFITRPCGIIVPFRGPGGGDSPGAIICGDAAVREFLPALVQAGRKARDSAKVRKRYHPPATPCQRLLADPRTSQEVQRRLNELRATLDPVRLLREVRAAQQQLVEIADTPAVGDAAKPTPPTLEQFLSGLRTAWQEGEVRPTSVPKEKPKRHRPASRPPHSRPASAKMRSMNGKDRRAVRSGSPAPSRSCTLAGWTATLNKRPSVSTRMCRLRPVIFLPASKPCASSAERLI
jgi:hypothetical protein